MTNVNVAAEGDLLTIKVDLTAVAKDLSHQGVENRILLELRRAAYGSHVPSSVSITFLAQRLRLPARELQPLLDQLAARRLILPGLTAGTYRIREWPPPSLDTEPSSQIRLTRSIDLIVRAWTIKGCVPISAD